MDPAHTPGVDQTTTERPLADHRGRTAVVTGGGGDIGRAIALSLAAAGARVIVLGRDRHRLDATREQFAVGGCPSGSVETSVGDLTVESTLDDLMARVSRIDVLVHNAAAYAPYAVLERSKAEDLAAVWGTVVAASVRLTQRVIPGMKAHNFGRILFIGSAAASLGAAGQVAYATAKSALVGLTRSLACETAGSGVTCNLLELGLIDTERVQAATTARRKKQVLARIPVGRMGTPHEIARIVTFLSSDDAGYIHGATIPATGGLGLGLLPFATDEIDANQ